MEDVVGLSEKLIDFANENNVNGKIAIIIGMSVEEMAINTIKFNNGKIEYIDIFSKIGANDITISFKDSGKEFDSSTYVCEEEGSLKILMCLRR